MLHGRMIGGHNIFVQMAKHVNRRKSIVEGRMVALSVNPSGVR